MTHAEYDDATKERMREQLARPLLAEGETFGEVCEEIVQLAIGLQWDSARLLHAARHFGGRSIAWPTESFPTGKAMFDSHSGGELFWIPNLRLEMRLQTCIAHAAPATTDASKFGTSTGAALGAAFDSRVFGEQRDQEDAQP